MEFEGKAYVVLVEKSYPLSVEVRVRFYESWDNGGPLTIRFKFEDGTRAHAHVPARYMLRVIAEPVMCDRKTNSDYVRFVSMFYFQFVPYVLDKLYFSTLCHMC